MRFRKFKGAHVAAALAILLSSCTSAPEPTPSKPATRGAQVDASLEKVRRLERARDSARGNPEVRQELASEYYQLARQAIDAGDEAQYRTYLAKAQEELIEAIRIQPASPDPHVQMGIIRAYQGDLDGAHTSFTNALRLLRKRTPRGFRGDGLFYTNIAQIEVYRGNLKAARRNLEIGRKQGAPPDEVDRIATLIAWRSGDRTEAREVFDAAAQVTPGYADTWDGAPLPQKMKSFDDFCAVCCRNPSCGPHMEDACRAESKEVKAREITRETLVEEMRLERERRAKLKEIYERERGLSIEVEDPDAAPASKSPSSQTPSKAPAPPASKPTPRSSPPSP
jgi:tetratricopeptide (TPR) repeat protein